MEVHGHADSLKSTRPDFTGLLRGTPRFYLESTLAAESNVTIASEARLSQVLDALNIVNSPNFYLNLSLRGLIDKSPPTSKMRSCVEDWLNSLDPNQIAGLSGKRGQEIPPSYVWKGNNWELILTGVPKPIEERKMPGTRSIISITRDWGPINAPSLFNALKSKAGRYGKLDLPYILGVNAADFSVGEYSLMNALFGSLAFSFRTLGWSRKRDGLLMGAKGQKYARISAVLFVSGLAPETVARRTPILWHNPWANKPLNPKVWEGTQRTLNLNSSEWEERHGKPVWEIFGLSPTWPEQA